MSAGPPTSSPSRMLVVEDEPSIRHVVARPSGQRYNAHEVGVGTAALAAATESAGLGLALTNQSVAAHGGSLRIEETDGGAATISRRVPPASQMAEPLPEMKQRSWELPVVWAVAALALAVVVALTAPSSGCSSRSRTGFRVTAILGPSTDVDTNAEIASRISPTLLDLGIALAAGAVGGRGSHGATRSDDRVPRRAVVVRDQRVGDRRHGCADVHRDRNGCR
ncbi:hypothetical protein [Ilumatobacter sp.]|uniref:DUF389 domain-containing protein n=1 Tax=Ilumatobacter sp. TaxID=1967498 RepID=UPI003C704597